MAKSRLRANIHFCSHCFDISLGELCLGHHDQNSKQKRVQKTLQRSETKISNEKVQILLFITLTTFAKCFPSSNLNFLLHSKFSRNSLFLHRFYKNIHNTL